MTGDGGVGELEPNFMTDDGRECFYEEELGWR